MHFAVPMAPPGVLIALDLPPFIPPSFQKKPLFFPINPRLFLNKKMPALGTVGWGGQVDELSGLAPRWVRRKTQLFALGESIYKTIGKGGREGGGKQNNFSDVFITLRAWIHFIFLRVIVASVKNKSYNEACSEHWCGSESSANKVWILIMLPTLPSPAAFFRSTTWWCNEGSYSNT